MLRITILHPSLRLSTEAPGKESATKKRGVERHCNRSSSSRNHVRKKGGGRSPLPIVFSLHPASSDVRLARRWRWRRSSTSNEWRREELDRRPLGP
jgi:hypothetical protein